MLMMGIGYSFDGVSVLFNVSLSVCTVHIWRMLVRVLTVSPYFLCFVLCVCVCVCALTCARINVRVLCAGVTSAVHHMPI